MADQTEKVITKVSYLRYVVFEVTLSTNDTVTLDDFTTIQDAALFNLDDGLEDTATVSTNVITLTESGITEKKYIGIALGY